MAHGGNRAGQNGGGSFFHSFAAHFFGDSRDYAVGDGDGGFRSVVAGADASSAGGEDDSCAAGVGDAAELLANGCLLVGEAQRFNNFPTETTAKRYNGWSGGVFALAFGCRITDCEDGYAHVREHSAV